MPMALAIRPTYHGHNTKSQPICHALPGTSFWLLSSEFFFFIFPFLLFTYFSVLSFQWRNTTLNVALPRIAWFSNRTFLAVHRVCLKSSQYLSQGSFGRVCTAHHCCSQQACNIRFVKAFLKYDYFVEVRLSRMRNLIRQDYLNFNRRLSCSV